MEVLVFLYPIVIGGLVLLGGAVFFLYKCLPVCWRELKETECDCCSNINCKPDCSDIYCKPDCSDVCCEPPDCSDVDCSCCRILVGGVLDTCRQLKSRSSQEENTEVSTEPTNHNANPASFMFESDFLSNRVRIPPLETTTTQSSIPTLRRTSSEPVLHQDRHIRDIFHASPRTRDVDNDDLDYIGDDLEIPECIEIDNAEIDIGAVNYSIDNETDIDHRIDIRLHVLDAPPSYNEATAADPPFVAKAISTSLTDRLSSIASEHPSLPTYDDYLKYERNFTKNS